MPTLVTVMAGHALLTGLGDATEIALAVAEALAVVVGAVGRLDCAAIGLWGPVQAASSMNVSSALVRVTPVQTSVRGRWVRNMNHTRHDSFSFEPKSLELQGRAYTPSADVSQLLRLMRDPPRAY